MHMYPSELEADRLAALYRYQILDTPPEEVFDDLTSLAAQICGTPIALISLVDAERQWFKARLGVTLSEALREGSFCAAAIQQPTVLVISDTQEHPQYDASAFGTDQPIRFYAGAPLLTPDGYVIGVLCALDYEPKTLSRDQIHALGSLSRQVISQIELRQQTASLATMVGERNRINRDLEDNLAVQQSILDTLSDGVLVISANSQILHVNRAFKELWGVPEEVRATNDDNQLIAWVVKQLVDPDAFMSKVQELYNQPEASSQDVIQFLDGRTIERYSQPHRLRKKIMGRVWTFRDITERLAVEARQMHLQEEIIQVQAAALAELSTPLIPLTNKAVLMPLIGSLDSQRAQQVVETLLNGIAANRADVAILDITGVRVVDTQVAHALIRAAQAVQLLGAQIIVTGIRAEVAQTLVALQVELRGIITRSSLQEGIRYVLGQQTRQQA